MNGMLISTSSTGSPGRLLRGSRSPRKLNIPSVATHCAWACPPRARPVPPRSGCCAAAVDRDAGANAAPAARRRRARRCRRGARDGGAEVRGAEAPAAPRCPSAPLLLVLPRAPLCPLCVLRSLAPASRGPAPARSPAAAALPDRCTAPGRRRRRTRSMRPGRRAPARQNAHSISISRSGTSTGSMPTRLKWMCQRMIASAAAARSGIAAGSRSSLRTSSRPRA